MRRTALMVVAVLLGVGWVAMAQETTEALEAKLDQLGATLQEALYYVDPLGNQELWFSKLSRQIGEVQYGFDYLSSTRLKNMETILLEMSGKIDGEKLVSDEDLAAHEASVIGQINANETKIDALEAKADSLAEKVDALGLAIVALEGKLDDESNFVDDSELASHEADVIAAITSAQSNLASAIAGVESKLDDESNFVDDSELAAAQSAIITEVDANEAKIGTLTTAVATVEGKLDGWITTATGRFDALDVAVASLETKLDDPDSGLAAIRAAVDMVEAKLDDETNFTDDSELATHEANVIAAVTTAQSALASAITGVEAKLDDETNFTDDSELAAAQSAIIAEVDVNEDKLDTIIGYGIPGRFDDVDDALASVEDKLDTDANFVDDSELAAAKSEIISEINDNEIKIDQVIGYIDTEIDSIESKLDGSNGLAAIKEDTGNIWGAVNNASYGLSSIKDDTSSIYSAVYNATYGLESIKDDTGDIYSVVTDTTYGLAALKSLIDDLEAKLDALATKVDCIYNNTAGCGS